MYTLARRSDVVKIPKDSGSNPSEESRWIEQLRHGEQHGFEKLYKFYFARLSQFVYRYVHSTHIAEDLVHNVFFAIWNNRKSIQPVETLRPYLYQACRNQALKHLRKEHEVISPFELINNMDNSHYPSPDEMLEGSEFENAVIHAVSDLPERRRLIYLMHREDGLTYKEISEVLEISIKTVETQMSRTLKHLRDKLSRFIPYITALLPITRDWL